MPVSRAKQRCKLKVNVVINAVPNSAIKVYYSLSFSVEILFLNNVILRKFR